MAAHQTNGDESQNGKRIVMRVRALEQENEELANVRHTGQKARLETEISLRQKFREGLKLTGLDMKFLIEGVENETEFIGNSLFVWQHRLNLAKATARTHKLAA
ncbi:hypothetical protein X801_05752 [Opisthorchis viverrini]|uniref:Uncharacterized protein n=1 Tax=Opisthorchis viverrini TaxID=6198 RepID=A0A1S8WVE5_OPIVI|nr:hypothetical protein X801_05752 [Opisthorchis viverrini]